MIRRRTIGPAATSRQIQHGRAGMWCLRAADGDKSPENRTSSDKSPDTTRQSRYAVSKSPSYGISETKTSRQSREKPTLHIPFHLFSITKDFVLES
ncbi:hypothetical protein L6452_20302 [Arctium lappa]|uniref:Uncharacterized protein n=1 Tax=Arctium lappa TaxID=4217 RepID=A0ACB9BB13_ARCLA|nr:hypothetical protein L6452_20302 [Arctium lappa]